ncbi:hypothetical protein [Dyella lutea]|uniref:Uncharacterized protein n=1 Tax=Dyella lutea TaxID=2950441 RepID=A0ABT1FG10_9GAMM|nr:hypothetical protein [Dyella lutea]MCP1375358.1 hypothetical protein [Dyella lutea]
MTFDDDFLQINFQGGTRRVLCKSIGVDWPPPEKLSFQGFALERVRFSQVSDDDRAGMEFLMRGAEYNVAAEG